MPGTHLQIVIVLGLVAAVLVLHIVTQQHPQSAKSIKLSSPPPGTYSYSAANNITAFKVSLLERQVEGFRDWQGKVSRRRTHHKGRTCILHKSGSKVCFSLRVGDIQCARGEGRVSMQVQ